LILLVRRAHDAVEVFSFYFYNQHSSKYKINEQIFEDFRLFLF
jgi:hypothetical protein